MENTNSYSYTSLKLSKEEESLTLTDFSLIDALELGRIATLIGLSRKLPIAIEIRIGDWMVYHASLPGSTFENQEWIDRKARVVILKKHSTLFERIKAQELGTDWHQIHNLKVETHAIHGGGLPINTLQNGFVGALLLSGLSQIEDHILGVEILTEFISNRGRTIE